MQPAQQACLYFQGLHLFVLSSTYKLFDVGCNRLGKANGEKICSYLDFVEIINEFLFVNLKHKNSWLEQLS